MEECVKPDNEPDQGSRNKPDQVFVRDDKTVEISVYSAYNREKERHRRFRGFSFINRPLTLQR